MGPASGPGFRMAHRPRHDGRCMTARQRAVLVAYCEAGSVAAAAHQLGVAESTVKNHLADLRRRCGFSSTAQAVWHLWPDLRRVA